MGAGYTDQRVQIGRSSPTQPVRVGAGAKPSTGPRQPAPTCRNLVGTPLETPWDPQLAELMATTARAIEEEAVLPTLLTDLRTGLSTSGT
ncbi:DUF2399 domain-containing protein [Saccharopolyspora sp. ASAGF58]|uniref:DUF2399 domain-containing protein n=1 Tax=Saccharopolyspora sp. ASAGF58 TaxID=2719023 RepID=UPI00143FBBF6|nr:DUF2399 domain-containing protein [Saccharopolyspora sp. ASAGF58]